jgi:hypothetical protein
MTVEEHLFYYGRIKQVRNIKEEVERFSKKQLSTWFNARGDG